MRAQRSRSHEPVAVVALVFSALCHTIAFIVALLPTSRVPARFPDVLALLVAASLAGSIAAFAVRGFEAFLLTHVLRLCAVLVALRLVHPSAVVEPFLLLSPYVAESCLYGGARLGSLLNALALAGAAAMLLFGSSVTTLPVRTAGAATTVIVGLGLTGACALLVHYRDQTARQRQRIAELTDAVANLSDANKAIQSYAGSVEVQSAAKERSRVTRELHDSIGYAFTNIVMTMNAAKALVRTDGERTERAIENARAQAETALADTRRILYRLGAIREVEVGGLQALARLVKSFHAATGVQVVVNYGNLPVSYGMEIDEAIFRLAQEGLTNAFRHGDARTVRITMWETAAEIRVNVWDDGRGLAKITEGIGLRGMRERFGSLGGCVEAKGTEDGFELRAAIPYRRLRRRG